MKFSHHIQKRVLPGIITLLAVSCSDNEVEFKGILDHRPESKDGMWVIDGKSFSVTENVELDEDDGPITIGSCVGLEMEDGDVKEIETMKPEECQQEK